MTGRKSIQGSLDVRLANELARSSACMARITTPEEFIISLTFLGVSGGNNSTNSQDHALTPLTVYLSVVAQDCKSGAMSSAGYRSLTR